MAGKAGLPAHLPHLADLEMCIRDRDKLGAPKYIKTVYGIGYSWVTKDE